LTVRARVRDLLSHLETLLSRKAPDFSQVDRLASALERLADLERVLAGRPLPGSRRPGRDDAQPAPLVTRRKVAPVLPTDTGAELHPGDDEQEEPPLYSEG